MVVISVMRERSETDESSGGEADTTCVQGGGVSGVTLNHSQVSLSSWRGRRGGWSAACFKSCASGVGAKLSLQAVPAAWVCCVVGTTQPKLPQNGKEVTMVATCHC